MENTNKNQQIRNSLQSPQKISKQKIIGALRSFVGEDGYIFDHDTGRDSSEHEITFAKPEDYRYGIIINTDESNYLGITLDFGGLNGFINEHQVNILKKEVVEANKNFRCVRGIIEEDHSSDDSELLFSVRYDSYILPGITSTQILLHVTMALTVINSYLDDTLDAARTVE